MEYEDGDHDNLMGSTLYYGVYNSGSNPGRVSDLKTTGMITLENGNV